MLTSFKDQQVVMPVVSPVSVQMMHDLIIPKASANHLFRYDHVFVDKTSPVVAFHGLGVFGKK